MPQPTLGEQCAAILKAEKLAAVKAGRIMSWAEVAQVIDGHLAKQAPKAHVKAPSSAFGDCRVIPPLPAWVTAYSASIGYPMDGEAWCDSYGQKDWKVGKTKMKDWQCGVRNWKSNGWLPGKPATTTTPKDYSKL